MMLMCAKVPATAQLVRDSLQQGLCCVVGLQSTGEAGTDERLSLGEALDDLVGWDG